MPRRLSLSLPPPSPHARSPQARLPSGQPAPAAMARVAGAARHAVGRRRRLATALAPLVDHNTLRETLQPERRALPAGRGSDLRFELAKWQQHTSNVLGDDAGEMTERSRFQTLDNPGVYVFGQPSLLITAATWAHSPLVHTPFDGICRTAHVHLSRCFTCDSGDGDERMTNLPIPSSHPIFPSHLPIPSSPSS